MVKKKLDLKELRRKAAQALAEARWADKTDEERESHGRMMAERRWAKKKLLERQSQTSS